MRSIFPVNYKKKDKVESVVFAFAFSAVVGIGGVILLMVGGDIAGCSWFKGGEVDSPVGTVKIKGTDKAWVPNPAPTTYVTNYFYGCSSSDAATGPSDAGKD